MKNLSDYNLPSDLKSMEHNELSELASQMREFLLEKLAQVGGHFGPNLGIIEAAIALHKVFNSPKDKIIWDVSHQSLPHKILTNRFDLVNKFHECHGASAFTNPNESEHDFFTNGHTSTVVSQGLGIAKARDFKGIVDENVVAVLGDGALSGGQALESINNLANLHSNFILVLNDNEMSIDFNSGGLYQGLQQLRDTNGTSENNIFKFMGLDYVYLEEGNDISKLVDVLEGIKDIDHPIVLHIHTKKGKGYEIAEKNPESWHYHVPFDIATGKSSAKTDEKRALLVNTTAETVEFIQKKSNVLAFIPGSPLLGRDLQETVPSRYIDTGIAEQTAVSYASSVASNGVKSYMVIASPFLQRAYDQVIHDWTINNSPSTLIVLGGGVTATDSTHNGIFDIPLLSNIPNLVYLSPSNDTEYLRMLDWCDVQNFPTAIRLPAGVIPDSDYQDREVSPIEGHYSDITTTDNIKVATEFGGISPNREFIAKSEVIQKGSKVAIFSVGIMIDTAGKAADLIEKELGFKPTIVNSRYISHLDTELINNLQNDHEIFITLEDGLVEGGFGAKLATYLAPTKSKTLVKGVKKEYLDTVKYSSILERYRLSPELILEDTKNILGEI
jgi:1-deoxy-D-xylulose-5-phosphate synthase